MSRQGRSDYANIKHQEDVPGVGKYNTEVKRRIPSYDIGKTVKPVNKRLESVIMNMISQPLCEKLVKVIDPSGDKSESKVKRRQSKNKAKIGKKSPSRARKSMHKARQSIKSLHHGNRSSRTTVHMKNKEASRPFTTSTNFGRKRLLQAYKKTSEPKYYLIVTDKTRYLEPVSKIMESSKPIISFDKMITRDKFANSSLDVNENRFNLIKEPKIWTKSQHLAKFQFKFGKAKGGQMYR